MNKKYWAAFGGLGCLTLLLLVAVIILASVIVPLQVQSALSSRLDARPPVVEQQPISQPSPALPGVEPGTLMALYEQVNPGVVNIKVYVRRGALAGQGAGSGFVLDDQGHIVTNNHVVAQAGQVTVVFFDGFEAEATIVGRDADTDLAVIKVDQIPPGAHPLPLGDSGDVVVGEPVIAIGNPFGLGSSMTAGIVSAVGRTIASGATPFSIPHAIQTDAAINPGNSGGPLLNYRGEVIGVNAQIATSGPPASAGVGFAIPVNIVRQVVPVLIERGSYRWPWLGVRGGAVNLAIMRANELPAQRGAYLHEVIPDGPAARAGLQGSTGTVDLAGAEVPVGGDVILEVDGQPITDFDTLLVEVSARMPGDKVELTIFRDGQRRHITVTLEARPRSD
jgi:2-alkenal reductase